jgi:signal transduction histidine kinase/DNA-binding NarL/FixJ family response regulator
MFIPEIKLHTTTFFICMVELVFFFYQLIYYLSRTSDKNRLYYLVLLYLLIQYNIVSDLLPNKQIDISVITQNMLVYFVAVIMAMYLPFYFYKVFNLQKLKFYAYWGSLLFLFIPFVFLFVIPYFITGNLDLSVKLLTVAPFFYSVSFFYSLVRVIIKKHQEKRDITYKEEIVGAIAILFWILLPIRAFFRKEVELFLTPFFDFPNRGTTLIIIITNFGLLLLTILFVRQNIRQSKSEYIKLLESEKKLQEMNSELTAKVKERTLALEAANEERTNAFINLAHDLKTPLTLINNYLEDYVKESAPSASLNIIQKNIEKLTKNVVNFFDTERIKKGVMVYDHEQISDLSKIVSENIILFQKYSIKRNIKISTSIEDNIFIKADPESLNRIINNIIENAIKYTEEGGKIDVSLNSIHEKIIFLVKDTGIGIPTNSLEKVFDPYFQINSQKANFQGMGLGLSIVKKIIDTLQGKIRIISNPDLQKGTEIIIELCRYNPKENEIVPEFKNVNKIHEEIVLLHAKDEISSRDFLSILVVEDNVSLLNLIWDKFRHRYNVYIALSGNEAIEKLKSITHLDLIISDVMMDNGNGFEFYKNVSQQKRFRHIPFIFLTAKTEDKLKGLELGAVDYIYKPFKIDELIGKVDSILKNISEHISAFSNTIHQSIVGRNEPLQPTISNQDRFDENCIKYGLTLQERKIIPLVAKGQTNKEMAEALFISDKTVKTHLQNIFEKVKATGKVDLLNKLEVPAAIKAEGA